MLSETIKIRLAERFAAPLPEFHKRRIVFWHDEDGEFPEEVDVLSLDGVKIVKLTGTNNFAVKKLLSVDDTDSDFLVYIPFAYAGIQDNWLLDIELYSEVFRADLVSLQMDELNIASTPELRKTVKLYSKFLENKERKSKLRKISRDYQVPLTLHTDIMAVLCGLPGGTAQDVIIATLVAGLDRENNTALANIKKYGNIEAFWSLIQKYTGFINDNDKQLWNFAAHILLTALSQTLGASALKGLERFISESCKAYCYQLVHEWQRSEHCRELFEICRTVERELRLKERFDNAEIDVLLKCDTLPAINESIINRFLMEISERIIKVDEILKAVENRRTVAWYDISSGYFDCLYNIAKMQDFYITHAAGFHLVEPKSVWESYTNEYYLMDTYYRRFHSAFGNTLKEPNPLLEDSLKKAAEVVEGLYREWYLAGLSACWTGSIAEDLSTFGYVSEIPKQRDFYSKYVSSYTSQGSRLFVVISDALRFEVAAELSERLSRETRGKATLESMQSIFPGITKFGMMALLPGKKIAVEYKNEKIAVLIDGVLANSTEKRGAVLQAEYADSIAVQYKDLLRMKKQERRDLVAGKGIIYIYHNEIDAIGDKTTTETKVFEACETAISELLGIVRIIVNDLSGANILITADHGFLYTYRPLEESQKISRRTFNGDVYELGRRYALASGNTSTDYLLPVKTDLEIDGVPMQGFAPLDTVRIRAHGGENYVHGGVSLQEMVVPVIVYKNLRADSKQYIEVKNPGLTLISESRKVSNLIFSLDFLQKLPIGDKIQPCTYSLRFTDEEGAPISDIQTVIADRISANAAERVFRVRFNLKSMAFDRNKTYRLRLANETDVPEEIEFCIDIAFADDFGFDL